MSESNRDKAGMTKPDFGEWSRDKDANGDNITKYKKSGDRRDEVFSTGKVVSKGRFVLSVGVNT